MDDSSQDPNALPAARPPLRPFSGQRNAEQGPLKLGGRRLARSPHLAPVVRPVAAQPAIESSARDAEAVEAQPAVALARESSLTPENATVAAELETGADTVAVEASAPTPEAVIDSSPDAQAAESAVCAVEALASEQNVQPTVQPDAQPDEQPDAHVEDDYEAPALLPITDDERLSTPSTSFDAEAIDSPAEPEAEPAYLPEHLPTRLDSRDSRDADSPGRTTTSALDLSTLANGDDRSSSRDASPVDDNITFGSRRESHDSVAMYDGALEEMTRVGETGDEQDAAAATEEEVVQAQRESAHAEVETEREDDERLDVSYDEVTAEWQIPVQDLVVPVDDANAGDAEVEVGTPEETYTSVDVLSAEASSADAFVIDDAAYAVDDAAADIDSHAHGVAARLWGATPSVVPIGDELDGGTSSETTVSADSSDDRYDCEGTTKVAASEMLDAELAGFALRPEESLVDPEPIPGIEGMLAIGGVADECDETDRFDAVEPVSAELAATTGEAAAPFELDPEPADEPGDHSEVTNPQGATASVTPLAHDEQELQHLVLRTESQAHVLSTLELVARRVRGGEIVPSVDAGASPEAVLASVLASILSSRT